MPDLTLYERIANYKDMGGQLPDIPATITDNLNPAFDLRPYQEKALRYFLYYLNSYSERVKPTQLLFHMATGSGKTLIMVAAILYLYQQGYHNFIFFVNSTNTIEKTKDNFLNSQSSKYLFAPTLKADTQRIKIQPVHNFQAANPRDINILFTTIQGLHIHLNNPRENTVTYEDFENQKIVLLSDESHHINALTKSSPTPSESDHIDTWEATVDRIFHANSENLLLEFTATVELDHPAVAEKYHDKILYQYSLKEFRLDGFSKEVKTLQADLPRLDRALQAIVVSQYRRKVAENHHLRLKPVVLMKSRYIYKSEEFEKTFYQAIESLSAEQLREIKTTTSSSIVRDAFDYFADQDISLENLAQEMKVEFAPEKCLSVNSKSESEEKQLLVNSLEDADNEIRLVFAVDKLNEGWDVLNLFDIVRLYNVGAITKSGKLRKTTVSEKQLIGRGARYFPFQLTSEQPRYKRKYDDEPDNELRVLEELYYHSAHNPSYIQKLHQVLQEAGIMPEQSPRQLPLNIKRSFKQSSFWENGLIFTNERVRNPKADVFGIQDVLTPERYTYSLRTGYTRETTILDDLKVDDIDAAETRTATCALKDFGRHLLRVALARLKFYRFDNLKTYFPHLPSISHFITSEDYLGQIKVDVTGTPAQLKSLTNQDRLNIALDVLQKLADAIRSGTATYVGTKEFKPQAVRHCVKEKTLNVYVTPGASSGPGIGMRADEKFRVDLSQEDWYVYDENYGTAEEKALVRFVQNQINTLRDRYTDIYLLRNQKLFQLYRFADGSPFEPDFVLFLTEKTTGRSLVYQLFIEPKGAHLITSDQEQWKEEFLKQIGGKHAVTIVFQNRDFKLVGLPFYNEQVKKEQFDKAFRGVLYQPKTSGETTQ